VTLDLGSPFVKAGVDNGVLHVRVNRPERRNAFTQAIKRAAAWANRPPDSEWDFSDHFPFRAIERCSKIWVARINGLCHAGGLDLALHCDVTVASDRSRFRVPELLRGIPDPYIAERLVATVGLARARFMIFTAAEIDARTAQSIGLVGEVVPDADLDEQITWVLDQIRRTGPSARAVMKRDINSRLRSGDPGLLSIVSSEELDDGMASFVEKRAPAWRRP
jgi:enoyl-CoA hydratase/carnithine racemase